SRLDTLQATILRIKLRELDKYTKNRQQAASFYDQSFADIKEIDIPARSENSTHVFHQYTLKVKNGSRDRLKEYLASKQIPSMIYYPVPLHLQKAYAGWGYKAGEFPVSEKLC